MPTKPSDRKRTKQNRVQRGNRRAAYRQATERWLRFVETEWPEGFTLEGGDERQAVGYFLLGDREPLLRILRDNVIDTLESQTKIFLAALIEGEIPIRPDKWQTHKFTRDCRDKEILSSLRAGVYGDAGPDGTTVDKLWLRKIAAVVVERANAKFVRFGVQPIKLDTVLRHLRSKWRGWNDSDMAKWPQVGQSFGFLFNSHIPG